MLVTRKSAITIEPKDLRIGDSIVVIPSKGMSFTATVHDVADTSVLFLADESVAYMPMNEEWTNLGGFKASNLNRWLQSEFLDSLPKEIKDRLLELSIPTYGMIFGHSGYYKRCDPDEDESLCLLTVMKYRLSIYNDELNDYWLANATKITYSHAAFATVSYDGNPNFAPAGHRLGVRPYFRIKK